MSTRVKNLNGTAGKSCTCPGSGSWLEHWKKKAGHKASLCTALDCKGKAEVGGHVKKVGEDRSHYIVPLCYSCNRRSDEFDSYYQLISANCD